MNPTTATCIAGIRSKTTSRTRIHFFPRPREAERFTRAFGLGILAKRLRWRPERNRVDGARSDEGDAVLQNLKQLLEYKWLGRRNRASARDAAIFGTTMIVSFRHDQVYRATDRQRQSAEP